MTLKGVVNRGFTSDEESITTQSSTSYETQQQACAWHDVEAGPQEPSCSTEDTRIGLEATSDARQDAGTDSLRVIEVWKDSETQTEGTPTTLHSWKILRTKSSSDLETSVSSSSECVVVETRSLGFDASVQTRDALMFRYNDAQVGDMVLAWHVLTVFMPSTWHMILYVADQMTSVVVAVDLCSIGDRWWCGLTLTFLVLPSIIINFYAYEQLTRPDIASVAPLNKWLARLLVLAQVAPHYLIGRKVSWCYRAWRAQSWQQKGGSQQQQLQVQPRRSPKMLWEQARADTDSATAKWFQSLLESVPQLSIQAYILMVKLGPDPRSSEATGVVTAALVASVVVSLTSASAGLASVMSENAWERVAAALAIFLTLGSRVLVCSGVGTIHPALWFAPLASATLLGFVTKVSESKEETYMAILPKTHKYLFEAFVMAAVCPPFNAVGLFSSAPYVLAGLCFLTLNPVAFLNIGVFILSFLGQVIWLAVGFFVT